MLSNSDLRHFFIILREDLFRVSLPFFLAQELIEYSNNFWRARGGSPRVPHSFRLLA